MKVNHFGKCQTCDYHTTNTVLMRMHQKRCGVSAKMYHCEHCEFKASSTFVLGVHRNSVHGRLNQCKYCDFSTENRSIIKNHMEKCKTSKESFFCKYCDKRFTFEKCMTNHIQYQHHRCRFCKHFAISELARKAHENGIHEKEMKGKWIVSLLKMDI